jgi:hypothetical protein
MKSIYQTYTIFSKLMDRKVLDAQCRIPNTSIIKNYDRVILRQLANHN